MNRILLLVVNLFFVWFVTNAQVSVQNDSLMHIERMAGVCKAWGLVKYYQPKVAAKKIDWDLVFINSYENLRGANDFDSYNKQLKDFLSKAMLSSRTLSYEDSVKVKQILSGELSKLDNFKILDDTLNYIHQPDFTWIKNDKLFSKEIQNLLCQIIIDYHPTKNKYIKGKIVISHEENPFSELDSVSEPYRLLGLFRYWNIVNYYYPYKNLADKSWDSVLVENIPRFEMANSYYGYYFQIVHLASEINDSHAMGTRIDTKKGLSPKVTYKTHNPTFYHYPPFRIELIDTNVVINKVFNDSLLKSGALEVGDILLKLNDKLASDVVSIFRNYSQASTEQAFRNQANHTLISYFWDTTLFTLTLLRGKDTLTLTGINGVSYRGQLKYEDTSSHAYYTIQDSIGYINLCEVKPRDLKNAYRKYKNLPTIIFDMRGYPSSNAPVFLPKMLSRRPISVANFYYPSRKYPGVFVKNKSPENYYAGTIFTLILKSIFGVKGKMLPTFNKVYQGKVIVLIDNTCISFSETVCMTLKAYAKDITFIGTPTQGANGDVIDFFLPGGIKGCFSSLDWHFPDGKQLQRVGIIPDIEVKRTIGTIKKGNDAILERAIQFALTGK